MIYKYIKSILPVISGLLNAKMKLCDYEILLNNSLLLAKKLIK